MGINWGELQRKYDDRAIKNARTLAEVNRSYLNREDIINGWRGFGGQLLLRYNPQQCLATFGNTGPNGACVGP